jgi:hypothetical protein
MDKYFQSSYDPRLDLGAVPKEGLVAEVGWDNMLAILKERGKKVGADRRAGLFSSSVLSLIPLQHRSGRSCRAVWSLHHPRSIS